MATNPTSKLSQQLRRAALLGDEAGLTDGQLLGGFVEHGDEAAFAVLVRRHGPMVLGVCRRLLGSLHDAEDAFQATFLVLVRKAAAIQSRETVANWLYGTAYNTALKARAVRARRRTREVSAAALSDPTAAPQPDRRPELQPLLDRELSRLSDKYRAPVVLCDLQGKTRKEAADQLGWPEGTVSSRLARARALLARRLTRQGVALSAGAPLGALSESTASAGVPASLVASTVQAASLILGRAVAGGAISANVAALTEGVLRAMWLSKLRWISLVLLIGGLVSAGAVASARAWTNAGVEGAQQEARPAAETPAKDRAAAQAPGESKVRTLLKERLDLLKKIAAALEKVYERSGTVKLEELAQAKIAVLKAELELCQSARERVAIHEKMVALTEDLVRFAESRYQSGQLPVWELLQARVNRLDAQIELERARAAAGRSR
jgi:RNA polymerase sigma factor (sigma-70 family)